MNSLSLLCIIKTVTMLKKKISGVDLYSSFLQKSIDGFTIMSKDSKPLITLPVSESLVRKIHMECVEIAKNHSLSLSYTLDSINLDTGDIQLTQHLYNAKKTSDFNVVTKSYADSNFDLVYIETANGFHIALDASFIDQVGDFEIKLPTGEIINTKNIN